MLSDRKESADLARALASDEHEVTLYSRRDDADLPDRAELAPGVTAVRVTAGPPRPLDDQELLSSVPEFGGTVGAMWREEPPDVIHAQSWRLGIAALLGRADTGTPVVHTFHGQAGSRSRAQDREGSGGGERSPRLRLERAVCHDVTHVLAGCVAQVGELARMGTPRSKVTVVPGAVDLDLFRPEGSTLPRGESPRLVCVGSLAAGSGFETTITALRTLTQVELVIAGGPAASELDNDPEARRLRAFAERCGVAERVRLLGRVPHERMPDVLRSADVVVCPARYESAGVVALEAAACGRPVVASATGCLLDTVIDGATGVLVQPGQPAALVHALRDLLGDPIRLEGFGIAARERARIRHSWTRIAKETAHVYTTLVA